MKQVVRRACQLRIKGKIKYVDRDAVIDYPKKHPCLEPIEGDEAVSVDFANASYQELSQAKWTKAQAAKAVGELYGVELDVSGTKKDTVLGILDARQRHLK